MKGKCINCKKSREIKCKFSEFREAKMLVSRERRERRHKTSNGCENIDN